MKPGQELTILLPRCSDKDVGHVWEAAIGRHGRRYFNCKNCSVQCR